jgi:hypothetical protein
MSTEEMNKCHSKFYDSARKQDGNYYKKTSLLSIRAALDRHQPRSQGIRSFPKYCGMDLWRHTKILGKIKYC